MGQRTKIDWCDATWNPVTGCLHGCEYCYARRIAQRFAGFNRADFFDAVDYDGKIAVVKTSLHKTTKNGKTIRAAYPFGFTPTFHRYMLEPSRDVGVEGDELPEPQRWTRPRTIFVCSMADLFGDWVPDEWIDDVIKATQRAPQHRYLFLTKNPDRYGDWLERFEESRIDGLDEVANCWFGASASNNDELERANRSRAHWLSIEPIRERIHTDEDQFMEFRPYDGAEQRRWDWVVIGAETGNSKNRVCPKKEWIDDIAHICKEYGTPVFMKESLRDLMCDDFRQEFPWEVQR